jgi:hypothetical protein
VSNPIPSDLEARQALRRTLGQRQAVPALGHRFRRDLAAYLRSLDDARISQTLPVWLFWVFLGILQR